MDAAWLNVTVVRAVAFCKLQMSEKVAETLDVIYQVKQQI